MLIWWLILQLCRSRAELRCVIRVVRACLAAQHAITQERMPPLHSSNLFQHGALRPRYRIKDARMRRSVYLPMVYAILVVQAESPQILAAAIIIVSIALMMGTLYAIGVLD